MQTKKTPSKTPILQKEKIQQNTINVQEAQRAIRRHNKVMKIAGKGLIVAKVQNELKWVECCYFPSFIIISFRLLCC